MLQTLVITAFKPESWLPDEHVIQSGIWERPPRSVIGRFKRQPCKLVRRDVQG